jgi:hypothetical protein
MTKPVSSRLASAFAPTGWRMMMDVFDTRTMRRIEKERGQLLGFLQDPAGAYRVKANEFEDLIKKKRQAPAGVIPFEDWQVVHFRLQVQDYDGEYLTEKFFCGCMRGIWDLNQGDSEVLFRIMIERAKHCDSFEFEEGEVG